MHPLHYHVSIWAKVAEQGMVKRAEPIGPGRHERERRTGQKSRLVAEIAGPVIAQSKLPIAISNPT